MKQATVGLLALVLVSSVGGQSAPAGSDPASLRAGHQLLGEVARAYREAPAFTDEVRMTYRGASGNRSERMAIALGHGADARVNMEGYVISAADGWFYIERESLPGKYYGRTLERNLIDTFCDISGGNLPPIPQGILRYSDRPDDHVQAFGVARARNLKLAGHRMVTRAERSVHELRFDADGGMKVTGLVDPDTKFIVAIRIDDGLGINNLDMNPKRRDRLPEAIAFDPSGRRQVENLADLRLGVGDPAPDFTLETLGGRQVTLSDHRGSVVVLDFWATWCGPCRWALPKLQQFARWAHENGHPVEVYAVDIGERQPTPEKIRQVVSNYWKSQGFTMSTLMDYDNTVAGAYEIGPIPHTVVIDPDGRVARTHIGLDPNMLERLKRDTLEALGQPR